MARKHLFVGLLLMSTAATYYYFNSYYSRGPDRISQGTIPTVVAPFSGHLPDCEAVPLFEGALEEQGWSRVDSRSEWYVYSAYIDYRPSTPLIRIIAMLKGDSPRTLFCRLWNEAGRSSMVRVQKQKLWVRAWNNEKPGRYYEPFLLSCPVPRSSNPMAVSVVNEPCGKPTHWIQLVHSNKSSDDFVVCLKPLDFEHDISLRLLEWLELQYILGADSVHVYVYRLHSRTWKILENYANRGKVVLRNYTLPGQASWTSALWQKRRHEMVVYNDCFYRHIHSHQFVVNLDLDEAIVPVLRDSWSDLMEDLDTTSASMSVRNVYFFDSFGEVDDSIIPGYMHMLRHVVRSANFTPPGFAQKSFFPTRHAEVVSNHFALRAVRNGVRLLSSLGTNRARLHHYRRGCPRLMRRDCEENYMRFREKDTLLWKFKDRLVRNVLQRMKELGLQSQISEERDSYLV